MESLNIDEITQWLGGSAKNCSNEIIIKGISTDSRNVKKGELFVALIGKNFDGHEFLSSVFEKGASAAVVSKDIECGFPVVKVDDTMTALKKIAKNYRKKFGIPVISVTGSTGKTSTKEMIASVLMEKFNVHKTRQNFNNEIGLPLTLMELERNHEISVLEMGMNNLGEIERLADIARPSVGVITNIGTAHIENLGTRENILRAKMEMTSYFGEESVLVINSDDEYLSTITDKKYRIIGVSICGKGKYNGQNIINLGEDGVEFTCKLRDENHRFKVNVPGVHNVYNALISIAVGDFFGLTPEEMRRGILNFKPGKLRMDVITLNEGIKVINDCYNANPDSMKAALDVLHSYGGNRKLAVLGDMFELGSFSENAHRDIGRYLINKCDILIAVGEHAKYMFEEAKKHIDSYYFRTKEEACQHMNKVLKADDVLLIKASRGMNMESITNYLVEGRKGNGNAD